MRINNNVNALNAQRNAAQNTALAGKSMAKLSSGLRINNAADDAAGLAVSEKMRGQIKGLDQAARNTQDGMSLIQTADGALQEVSDALIRMKELTVQKANGTYNDKDVEAINAELDQLGATIDSIVDDTKFNGKQVLDGTESFDIIITDNDAGSKVEISADASAVKGKDNSVTTTDIEDALDSVNELRATLGAQQNRLERTYTNLTVTSENLTTAESRIRDVDMAKEMVELSKLNILNQAAQSMVSQANQQPQNITQLLR